MSDDPRTPDDDLLRSALHAEAGDVHADDELLARIRTATAPPSIWRRRTPLLAMAAAVVVLAGLAAMLLAQNDDTVVLEQPDPAPISPLACSDGEDDIRVYIFLEPIPEDAYGNPARTSIVRAVSDLGGTTILSEAVPDAVEALRHLIPADPRVPTLSADRPPYVVGAAFSSTSAASELASLVEQVPSVLFVERLDCRLAGDSPDRTDTTGTVDPPSGERPTVVALVREDGMLVTVDLETGEERELHSEGDPRDTSSELGPQYIDSVDLSPDGEWIYFSTCCEPADGMSFRIPTSGGAVEDVGFGAYPRVSPDGRYVVTAGSMHLRVYRTDELGHYAEPALLEVDCCAKHLAWSPDGAEVALVFGTGAQGETPQIRRFAFDGSNLTEVDMGKPDNPGWFALWTPDGTLTVSDGDPIADDRGRSQDHTFRWILWVDEAGVVKEQAGVETGDVTPIPDLPTALAADW